MKILKVCWGLLLFGALIVVVQLVDSPLDSPVTQYQRLPEVGLRALARAQWAAGRPGPLLLLADYVIENNLPDKTDADALRQEVFAQLASDRTPASWLQATGWAAVLAGGNSFDSLAGSTVADAVLYGDIADLAQQGALDHGADPFIGSLNDIRGMSAVFPPADGAIALAKAARLAGAINESLTRQLTQMLNLMQADPKSALAVEKFKENFMPMLELAKRCRTWGEFQVILQQASSADQMKVLIKIASATPDAARSLSQVLTVADQAGPAAASACLDQIMRQGPRGLDSLHAALRKGAPGLKFVVDHPGLTPQNLATTAKGRWPMLDAMHEKYQSLHYQYGAIIPAWKYLVIAILCGLLVLVVVPGQYLEQLIARPGGPIAAPGAIHYLLSALAVGVVLSGLAYLLSLAWRPAVIDTGSVAAAVGPGGAPSVVQRGDNGFLSGTVVLLSLAIHAVVWFYVRGKIRQVEDDERSPAELRLRRLENLDVFLDLPLFTGLALTVVAFILIALDAGMSRHFAYTSTVVGILSSVSLRIRYQYPLKERLIQAR